MLTPDPERSVGAVKRDSGAYRLTHQAIFKKAILIYAYGFLDGLAPCLVFIVFTEVDLGLMYLVAEYLDSSVNNVLLFRCEVSVNRLNLKPRIAVTAIDKG